MSDNPLDPSPAQQQAIYDRAQHMWQADGSPAGGPEAYYEQADALIRMEGAGATGQLDNPMMHPDKTPGVIVDEAILQENLGEFPGGSSVADQGEWRETPMTREELRHPGDNSADRGDAP